ncbi:Uncharacterised protein [Mycobacteroides abscessus subsp. abscessus]|nr:Uncharacterised protein [Mycobacteroides abscessus subsp. abscessus]
MPGPIDQEVAPVIGPVLHASRMVGESEYRICGARDEERGHYHVSVRKTLGESPIAVEVPVPVQAAGESGSGEFGDVMVQLVLAQPFGQLAGIRHALNESRGPGCDHRGAVDAGHPSHHAAHRGCRVPVEIGVGDARFLEVQDVEEVVAEQFVPRLCGRDLTAPGEGHREADHSGHAFGDGERGMPGDHGAPVVSDECRLSGPHVIENSEEVIRERLDVVVIDVRGHA